MGSLSYVVNPKMALFDHCKMRKGPKNDGMPTRTPDGGHTVDGMLTRTADGGQTVDGMDTRATDGGQTVHGMATGKKDGGQTVRGLPTRSKTGGQTAHGLPTVAHAGGRTADGPPTAPKPGEHPESRRPVKKTFPEKGARGFMGGLKTQPAVKVWLLALMVMASAAPLQAQESFPLLGLTNTVWTYLQAQCPVGTGWEQAGYDDSPWPSGLALLAFENNPAIAPLIHTVLQPPSLLNGGAVYFRTRFVWPHATVTATLEFSNRVDDCVALYLNGSLLTNAGVSGSPLTCSNFGRAAITGEAIGPEVFRIPATLLAGTNVLAAEVHQMNAASADVVWGCSLNVVLPRLSISVAASTVDLCWTTEKGVAYRVEYRPDLGPGLWSTVRNCVYSEEARACISESVVGAPQGFYRVVLANCIPPP